MWLTRLTQALARSSPGVIGAPLTFALLAVAVLVWLVAGALLGYSSGWLLVPSAGASIVALMLIVLLQYTENRDTRALQLKLDEVIRALDEARTELLGLERRSDDELDTIESELEDIRRSHD